MLKTIRTFLISAAAVCAVSVTAFAGNALPEIFPDSNGVYSYTYETEEPYSDVAAVVLKGLYDDGAEFDLAEASSSEILYYNIFTSDKDGDISMNFVPTEYADATLFVGGEGAPEAVCHIMQGEAVNITDFELVLDEKEYTVSGVGTSAVFVQYRINAVDSFGYPSTLYPSVSVRNLGGYTGDKMAFVENAHAIQLENTLEAGDYSFSVSYGGITKTASFTVKHDKSKPLQTVYYVNGKKNRTNFSVDCINLYPTAYFNPEKVEIRAEVTDQYENEMAVDWTFTVTDPDGGKTYEENQTGIFDFVPPEKVLLDLKDEYKIVISAPEVDFSKTVKVTVSGISSYTGDSAALYREYSSAKDIVDMYENGELVLSSDNGNDVHYTKSWTTPEMYSALVDAIAEAEANFKLINAGELSENQISKAKTAMRKAVSACKISEGQYAPIEKLSFETTAVSIAVGGKNTLAVKSIPTKPSEKPVYRSEDPTIASVDSRTGAVTAKGVGTTKIFAENSDASISTYYEVTVYTPIKSMKFALASINLIAGETYTPVLTALPEDHTDKISYMSSSATVAKVSGDGVITAVGEGTAYITASSVGGASAKITVFVSEPNIETVESCIAKPGSKLSIPLTIDEASGISKLVLSVSYNAGAIAFGGVTDLEFLSGFSGASEISAGKAEAVWDGIVLDKIDGGKFAELNIEVLESAEMKKYDLTLTAKGYTENGSTVNWNNGTSSSLITEKKIKIELDVGEKDTYTIKADAGTGGTAGGGGEFKFGETATVRAYPSSSYDFLGWYVSGKKVSSDKEYSFEVTEALTVQARFTVKSGGGGGGGGGGSSSGGGGGGGASAGTAAKAQVSMVSSNYSIGAVAYGTEIILSSQTVGASIYYTLDGSIPTTASILYTAPIKLTGESTTISAIAVKSGMNNSNLAIFTYRIENMPEDDKTAVSISMKENGAEIKYLPVNGYYIRPDDPATRYEVIEMTGRLFDVSGGDGSAEFSDVSEEYSALIGSYVKANIINGYPDGTFGGEKQITRAELVKILSVMLGIDTETEETSAVTLSDISGHWAEKYVKAFVARGYILGYPEGDFRPDRYVTRAEAVTIINRISGKTKISGSAQYFADMDADFWGYDEIMSAADIPQ